MSTETGAFDSVLNPKPCPFPSQWSPLHLLPHLGCPQSPSPAKEGRYSMDPLRSTLAERAREPALNLPPVSPLSLRRARDVSASPDRANLNNSKQSTPRSEPNPVTPLNRKYTEPHLVSTVTLRRRHTQPHLCALRESGEAETKATKAKADSIQDCVANASLATTAQTQNTFPNMKRSVFEVLHQKKNLSPHMIGTFSPWLSFPTRTPRNLLVLDIDETLVHASVEPKPCDIRIPVVYKNASGTVYVRLRPYLAEFLEEVYQLFDVVTFTASLPLYAGPLMDALDPNGRLKGRFYREHCTNYGGLLVKDLVRLGWPLERCIIIDNSPQAFALQPRNGIPIPSFAGDAQDRELVKLLPLLRKLSDAEDVYPLLDAFNSDL